VRLGRLAWRVGALIRPPVTLGVRCLVLDETDRILLIRHTYTPGWHFPGGAVDAHETVREAAAREVVEETGYALAALPEFFALYFNRAQAGRDHVVLCIAAGVPPIAQETLNTRSLEIAEVGMFARDALPEGTSGSVSRRLAEWSGTRPVPDDW